MTPSSRMLNHEVAVWRRSATVGAADDWNQAVEAAPAFVGSFPASVQPRTLEELAAQHEGGPVVSEYVVYLRKGDASLAALTAADYIVTADGVYELQSDPKDQAGRGVVVAFDAEQVAA